MMLVDVNLLLYVIDTTSPHHAAAKVWWEGKLSEEKPLGLAWVTILAFLRLSTNPKVFRNPCTITEAIAHVESWLARPFIHVVAELPDHWERLQDLLRALGVGGDVTTDAHLTALALERAAELCSADRDFARFPGLKWRNPLASAPAGAAS